jgi:HAD superfamily hydrolase (TIGR01484 family)
MSQFKAIIFDLDGTAIPTRLDAVPSPQLIDAVKKAQGLVKVCFATGRSLPHAREILKAMHLTDPCVVSGGTRIIDPQTEKTLWEKGLSEEQVKDVIEVLMPYSHPVGFSDEVKGVPAKEKVIEGSERVIYVWTVEKDVAEQIKIQLNRIHDIAAHIGGSWTKGRVDIHITHKYATKQYALEELIEILGVEKENIIGIGDSDNDLPLFESVGFKVAMGNATESLKSVADFIAPSVDEDGLAEVIKKFILLTE